MRYRLLFVSLLMSGVAYAQTTPPTAADDTFRAPADDTLAVGAPGVLANDTEPTGDSLAAVLVSPPANGTLALRRDGSFAYTPNPGFTGTDSFTYYAEAVTPEQLVVEQEQSGVRFEATLNTALGDDADSDSSSIAGLITADVTPNIAPYAEVHITRMDLVLADSLDLSFTLGIFGVGGRLDVATEPDSMQLAIVQPGAPAVVAEGLFTQDANDVGIAGTLHLEASGLIGNVVQDGPQPIDVVAQGSLTGTLAQVDTELFLLLPIDLEGTFEVEGNAVDVKVTGSLVARGPNLVTPPPSNTATVSLVVDVNTAAEAAGDEVPARLVLAQNYPNPFNPETTIGYALPAAGPVSLVVYDVLGRAVTTLVEAHRPAGRHTVRFDASGLPGGVYVYRLQAGASTATKTLIVLK